MISKKRSLPSSKLLKVLNSWLSFPRIQTVLSLNCGHASIIALVRVQCNHFFISVPPTMNSLRYELFYVVFLFPKCRMLLI